MEKASFLFYEKAYNPSMQSLFEKDITPLASLLRPESLDDLVGQSHLVGEGKSIRKFIEAGRLPSILLW
jgi:putative ATPase